MKKVSLLSLTILLLCSCGVEDAIEDGTVKCQEMLDVSFKIQHTEQDGYFATFENEGKKYATSFTKLWSGCWIIVENEEAVSFSSSDYEKCEPYLLKLSKKDLVYGIARYDYEHPLKYEETYGWKMDGYQTVLIRTLYEKPGDYSNKTEHWWC